MKVRAILIRLILEGQGIVNFDSKDQKWIYFREESHINKRNHDGVTYAKRNFYRDADGNLQSKLKISRDCILKSTFDEDMIAQSSAIMHHESLLYNYIASPYGIIRGYLLPTSQQTLKRKSALTLSAAEQTCNAIPYLETFSKSGDRGKSKEAGEKSSNNFYEAETVGNISYLAEGILDLGELQFLGADQSLDRFSINPDGFDKYKQVLDMRLDGAKDLELKFYKLDGSVVDIAELGVLLTPEQVKTLTKHTLYRLLTTHIKRKSAFAKTIKMQIKLVEDPLKDLASEANGWIDIKNSKNIDDLDFDVKIKYVEVDQGQERAKRAEWEAALNADKKDTKKKRQKKNEVSGSEV